MQKEDELVEEIEQFEEAYENYVTECECAIEILRARLKNLQRTGDIAFRFYSRIKKYESLIDKCNRKGYKTDIAVVKKKVRDIGAMRIVTTFRDDIYKMVKLVSLFPGVSVIDEDNYVEKPKENGYSSYHIIVMVENMVGMELKKTPIEIQIRDNAMEFWASMEHEIFYKKNHDAPEIQMILKQVADNMTEAAELAMQLRDDFKIIDQEAAKASDTKFTDKKSDKKMKIPFIGGQ